MNSIGIDVSKDSLQTCIKNREAGMVEKIVATHTFKNTKSGYKELLEWSVRKCGQDCAFFMEATGVYHECLCDYLYAKGMPVFVVLPNKIKYYAKGLNINTKNDIVDAKIIAQYGLDHHVNPWKPMSPVYAELRGYSRAIDQMKQSHAVFVNRLHAASASTHVPKAVLRELRRMTEDIEKSIRRMEMDMLKVAEKDPELMRKVNNIAQVRGLGVMSVLHVLCETNGFGTTNSIKQLTSYAGLDVIEYQSGTINRRPRISKRGNCRIRRVLYMPALVAATNGDERLKGLYNRVVSRNPKAKKKGIIAVERKLLALIYTLWKNDAVYDPNFENSSPKLPNFTRKE